MRKYHILALLIVSALVIGCGKTNEKVNSPQSNDDNQTQIVDNNTEIDVNQPVDNIKEDLTNPTNNNSDNNSNKTTNNSSSKNSSKSNSSGNNSNNETQNSNSNTNSSSGTKSNNQPTILEPTIKYYCDSPNAEMENEKCVESYTYPAILSMNTPYSCSNGYVYKSGKCYIKKEPNEIKYCDNQLARIEGDFCVEGAPYNASQANGYDKSRFPSPYSVFKEESYIDYAQINCPEGSTKKTTENSKTYCLDSNEIIVKPLKATCSQNTEKLNSENNNYYCSGILYYYYYCSQGGRLNGSTCTPGVSVKWGMYCDDNSSIINGKCLYETNIDPTANYNCNDGDKKVDGKNDECVHTTISTAKATYTCQDGYTLTSDKKCKLN